MDLDVDAAEAAADVEEDAAESLHVRGRVDADKGAAQRVDATVAAKLLTTSGDKLSTLYSRTTTPAPLPSPD